MTRRITVWTPVTDENVASAIALLRHLDAQTLRVGEWELVLAASPGPHVSDLERAASHRPNVRVVVDEAGDATADVGEADDATAEVGEADEARVRGEWVLVLDPDDRLEPTALSRLAQLGSEAGDREVLSVRSEGARRDAGDRALVLTRHGSARSPGAASGAGPDPADVVVATPLRRQGAPSAPEPAYLLDDVTAEVRWVDGVLELHGRAPLHAAGASGADIVLVGRVSGIVRAHPVDAFTVSGDDEDTEPGLLWTARVPVVADDVEDELEIWLEVQPSDTDDEEGVDALDAPVAMRRPLVGRVAAAPGAEVDAPAVVDSTLVSVRSDPEGIVVDIGATGHSLLGRLDPREATVVEDATGSLLTIVVPQLAHRGTGVVDGALVLDGVPLPARLIVDERPRVQCRLVGSPGRAALEWRFGPGPAGATGCEVVTSPTGEFVVANPLPEEPVRPAPATRPNGPARPQATGPVAALRRRLPRGVDPVVAKLSSMPTLRGAYRRATGLQ